jgi:hypothetical protein
MTRMRAGDLDAFDIMTLRLWRAGNLVGWGTAGAVAFALPWILGRELGGRVSAVILLPLGIIGFVLLPYVAGGVVGDHVYRWPASVAAVAVGGVHLWWFVASGVPAEGWPGFVGGLFVALLIATTTSRYRWERRPRALRGTSSR